LKFNNPVHNKHRSELGKIDLLDYLHSNSNSHRVYWLENTFCLIQRQAQAEFSKRRKCTIVHLNNARNGIHMHHQRTRILKTKMSGFNRKRIVWSRRPGKHCTRSLLAHIYSFPLFGYLQTCIWSSLRREKARFSLDSLWVEFVTEIAKRFG